MQLGIRIYLEKLLENQEYCCNKFDVLEIQDFVMPNNLSKHVSSLHKKYKELLKGFNGEITIHGPYMDLNPISMDEGIRKITWERYLQAIEVAKLFNAKWIVIHSYFSRIHNQQSWYQDYWTEENYKFWSQFKKILEREKINVVLENIFDANPKPIKILLDKIDSPYFNACLDVGHCNVFSDYSLADWLQVLGDRLKYLHISDNDGNRDEHLSVGSGNIDFRQLMNNLPNNNEEIFMISESFCPPEEEMTGLKKLVSLAP